MYIVHPMWFYLYGLLGKLECLSATVAIISLILAGISGFIFVMCDPNYEANGKAMALKCLKPFAITGTLFLFLNLFLPTQTTFLQMAAASYATKENVGKAVQVGKELKDTIKTDLIDIIKSIKEYDEPVGKKVERKHE